MLLRIVRALGLVAMGVTIISVTPAPSCADSWMMPETTTYTSSDGHARIVVTPRGLSSQLGYFEDKVTKAEPAGQKKGAPRQATARVEQLRDQRWELLWEGPLLNEVAPVSTIIRDDGAYVVTFDNWHSMGYGTNVIVVYGPGGKLIKSLELKNLVPPDYFEALPRSVSSIHWRGDPHFSTDRRAVLVPVVIPSDQHESDPATVEMAIDLHDGRVAPADPAAWEVALAKGREVHAHDLAYAAAERAAFLAPMVGPRENTEPGWHEFLREAVARRFGDKYFASTTVLRMPDAEDYAQSEPWVRKALTDDLILGNRVSIASLSETNLVAVLRRIAPTLRDHSLSKVTVYLALTDHYWQDAVAVLRKSGAKLVQLDPSKPIPQRPERIARRYGRESSGS